MSAAEEEVKFERIGRNVDTSTSVANVAVTSYRNTFKFKNAIIKTI